MADDVDEALEETFPASDPPANTVETGIGVNDEPLKKAAAAEDAKTANSKEKGSQYSANASSG